MNRRPSALATPTRPGVDIGHLTGSAYQRSSCRRRSEMVSSPSSPVSQAKAAFASPAASGSSRVRVSNAWLSVIMTDSLPQPRCARLVRALLPWPADDVAGAAPRGPPGRPGGDPGPGAGIYDEPELYEAACAYRDVPGEVSALLRWSEKHGKHAKHSEHGNHGVLELAAGPAEHSRELARRGLNATTVDLSPAMCARARELAAADNIALTVVQADMRDFAIPRQFDLAITMLNSLCHLLPLDDLLRHLACLARHVTPGGLYIIELAHPADFLAAERRTSSEWSSEVDGGTVSVRWGGGSDEIDPVTQITREDVSGA